MRWGKEGGAAAALLRNQQFSLVPAGCVVQEGAHTSTRAPVPLHTAVGSADVSGQDMASLLRQIVRPPFPTIFSSSSFHPFSWAEPTSWLF